MADHMRTGLVTDALQVAIDAGGIAPNAIFHSDRGSQYTSDDFKAFLDANHMVGSMGQTGVCPLTAFRMPQHLDWPVQQALSPPGLPIFDWPDNVGITLWLNRSLHR